MGEKGKDGSGCPLISYPGAATGRCKPWQGAQPRRLEFIVMQVRGLGWGLSKPLVPSRQGV